MSLFATMLSSLVPFAKTAPKNDATVAFHYAVIALGAKLSAADGIPRKSELEMMAHLFPFPGIDVMKLRSLFVKHAADETSLAQYARQIMAMQPAAQVTEELVRRLVLLAACDHPLSAKELDGLFTVAAIFNVPEATAAALMRAQLLPKFGSAYSLLGISRRATAEEARAVYLDKARALHPDQFAGHHFLPATLALLNEKLVSLNAAYEEVRRDLVEPYAKGANAAA